MVESETAGACGGAAAAEMDRAVRALRGEGFESGILYVEKGFAEGILSSGENLPSHTGDLPSYAEDLPSYVENLLSSAEDLPSSVEMIAETLFLSDSADLLRRLREHGCYTAGYSHAGNQGEHLSGVSYILQEPDLVDRDSWCKIYEREAGLPWTILRTPRCLVREFTEEDLDGIYALYDEGARRFLEPPSEDRAHEREVLRAYIRRYYGLYGFGHWAVIDGNGSLIGRIGFAAMTSRQEQEAVELGIHAAGNGTGSGIDADFGFLLAPGARGKGIAEEVCRALLDYGFSALGFSRVRADARCDNTASVHLLEKLGFTPIGTAPADGSGEGTGKEAGAGSGKGPDTKSGKEIGVGKGKEADGESGEGTGDGTENRRIVFLLEAR